MILFVCSVNRHSFSAGIPFNRLGLTYSIGLRLQQDVVFSQKKLRMPNKMSEGGRYIIAETRIPVKGRWYAD